ncbi:MAG: ester cyclase, partial [Vicinamibacterales bacterium]
GPEGMTAALDAFYAGFPDLQITLDAVLAEPDKGVTRGTATGTHQGSFMNVPGTGKTVRIPYIDMWVAYDGRFIENWVFMDMVGLLVQIGAMPAP